MSTFKIKNSLGTIVEVPNEHRKHIEKLLADDKHSEIDTFISNLPKRQMGGQEQPQQQGNEQLLQQIVQSVAEAIQQGADPNQVLQQLIKQGIPQDKAQQLVQYVVSQMQGQQPQQSEDDLPAQPEMMEGGMLYQDQWKLPQERQKILLAEEGGELDEMKKGGSGIHIKESHKGRFTEWAKRHGYSMSEAIQKGLHSPNSHVRQMANFARNAKHFKHKELGGDLEEYGTAGQFGMDDDYLFDITQHNTLANTQNNPLSKDLLAATQFGNYDNMMWALPNKGLLGKIKAGLGIASGLSGAALGYNKLFAKDQTKNMLSNPNTNEYGEQKDIYAQRQDRKKKDFRFNPNDPNFADINNANLADLIPKDTSPISNMKPKSVFELPLNKNNYQPEFIQTNGTPIKNNGSFLEQQQTPISQEQQNEIDKQKFFNAFQNPYTIGEQTKVNKGYYYEPVTIEGMYDEELSNSGQPQSMMLQTNQSNSYNPYVNRGKPEFKNNMPNIKMRGLNRDLYNKYEREGHPSKFKEIEYIKKDGGELPEAQRAGQWGNLAGSTDTHFPNIVPPMDYANYDLWSSGNMGTMASSIGDIVDSANIASMYKGTGNMPNFNPMAQSIDKSGVNDINFATWMNKMKAKGIDPINLASWVQRKGTRNNKFTTGDPLGVIAANNSLSGMGMAAGALQYQDMEKDYNNQMRELGMSVNKYKHKNPLNPNGTYTVNAGVGPNYDLLHLGQIQDIGTAKCGGKVKHKMKYEEGVEYDVTDEELEEIKRNGGTFELLN